MTRGKHSKRRRKKKDEEPAATPTWTCPVCGEIEPEGTACSTCQAEQVKLPGEAEPLLRLRGTVAEAGAQGFELELPHGETVAVAVDGATERLDDPEAAVVGAVEVLGHVTVVFDELEGGLRDAPSRRFAARARMVAAGAEAAGLVDAVLHPKPDEAPAPVPEPPDEEKTPDRLRVEREDGAVEITLASRPGDLFSPRAIPVLAGLFYLPMLARARPEFRYLLVFGLLLFVPALYFWLLLLNRRVIRLDGETLSVRFGPIPQRGWSAPLSSVRRLEDSCEDPPHTSLATYRPDALFAELADGSIRPLLRRADDDQVYFVRDLLASEARLRERPERPGERRVRRRRLLRKTLRYGLVLLLLLIFNHTLWPGYSLVLQASAMHEALRAANECHEVRQWLGEDITWTVGPHWPDRGCGEDSGRLSFLVKGNHGRGTMRVRYSGMGCGGATAREVYVIVGKTHIDALVCIVDHRFSK